MSLPAVKTALNHNFGGSTSNGQASAQGTKFVRDSATVQVIASPPVSEPLSASAGGTAVCDSPAAARRLLQSSVYREVRALTSEIHEDVLILRGQVSSWYQKQVAQEIVRHVPGISMIVSYVKVVP